MAVPLNFLPFLVPIASLLICMSCLLVRLAMFKASNDEAVIEAANGQKCVCVCFFVEWLLGCCPTLLLPSLLVHVFTRNGVKYLWKYTYQLEL